jgi:cystathionine beta-lyase/cystathionine gamma-synthase
VVGRGLYHECRALLRASSLERRVVEVDENDTAALVGALEDGGMLFLDALCNAHSVAICDLRLILEHAAARDMSVVVDTTCLSASCRPFLLLPAGARCRLIVFESLTKYAQFGLDKIAAGLILATRQDAEALDVVREHLGTNITDVSACTLPAPNRRRLLRRLTRMERNARVVVRHINDATGSARGRVAGAVHPTLPCHPSCRVARSLPFGGALITLSFAGRSRGDDLHAAIVERMLGAARASGSPLCAGASFGLDVTRVYRTTTGSEADAFVRIAPGIEDAVAIDRLGRALGAACMRL